MMIRLLEIGLGAVALWLALLLVFGELGGWVHLLPLAAVVSWATAAVILFRQLRAIRSA